MEHSRVLFESASSINRLALARIRKGIGRSGDVLFSHKGTVGKLALVQADAPPFVCSPQTTFWRTMRPEVLDRTYLYYFMQGAEFREQWEARKGETDMADYVSLTAQRALRVTLPPIDEQRSIAGLLGALDDKIELNRQMNHTLEETASVLFERVVGDAGEDDDLEVPAQALIDRGVLIIGDGYRAKRRNLLSPDSRLPAPAISMRVFSLRPRRSSVGTRYRAQGRRCRSLSILSSLPKARLVASPLSHLRRHALPTAHSSAFGARRTPTC